MCECENCRYCRKHYVGFSRQSKRTEYYCNHEDQGQIEKYFREREELFQKLQDYSGFHCQSDMLFYRRCVCCGHNRRQQVF